MDQEDINAALRDLIDGREGPWRDVVSGLRDGSIAWSASAHRLIINAVPNGPLKLLGDYLQALREHSGISQGDLADSMGVSLSSVTRILHGRVLGSWPTVRVMVQELGGDTEQARVLWNTARQSKGRNP